MSTNPQSNPINDQILRWTEATLQSSVERLALTLGWLKYHTHDSRRSDAGFPDLVLVKGRRVIFAELKTSHGRHRPDQTKWLQALAAAGQEAYTWRPKHWINGTIRRALLGEESRA